MEPGRPQVQRRPQQREMVIPRHFVKSACKTPLGAVVTAEKVVSVRGSGNKGTRKLKTEPFGSVFCCVKNINA